MHPGLVEIAGMVVVTCAAAVLQSAVGFGFALLATPLLLWLGVPLPQTIVIVSIASSSQSALSVWRLRDAVPWRLALLATGVSMAAMLPGVLLLKSLLGLSAGTVKLVVSALICLLVALQWALKLRPRASFHWGWGAIAFGGCGVLTGVSGMGGPPLVLWSLAHDWPAEKTRGFLLTVFTLLTPLQLVLYYFTLGEQTVTSGILFSLMLVPAAFLGATIGLPIGNRLSRPALRTTALTLLLVVGLAGIGQAVAR